MRTRLATLFATGCVALAGGLALAGCGEAGLPGSPSPSVATGTEAATPSAATPSVATPSAATAELTAAAQKLNDDTVTVTLESAALRSTGNLDPRGDKAGVTFRLGGGSSIDLRAVGEDAWVRATGVPGIDPGKWLHVAGERLAGTSFDPLPEGDAAGASRYLERMADVTSTGDGTYRGTLDLTKAAASGVSVDVLGGKGDAVPFTATVDDQGRLSSLTIDLTAVDPALGTVKTTYSGFGEPVTVTPPPANEVTEAPESLTRILGGS